MKRCKPLWALLLAIVLTALTLLPVSASEEENLSTLLMGEDLNAYARQTLPSLAGEGGEWLALYLALQEEAYDLSEYAAALAAYFSSEHRLNPVERQRCALAWLAAGGSRETAAEMAKDSIGSQGIMSWIFGLHLLHNGVEMEGYTTASVADTLVSLQLADGGFALSGQYADADVTAMVLQALAPIKEDYADTIEKGIACLASKQQPDGGFKSYGVSNPESVAQVVIALTALGLDPRTDPRFSGDMTEAWKQFRLEDGSYSHIAGGKRNENAGTQVLLALAALSRFDAGKGSLYLLDTPSEDLPEISFPEESTKEESVMESSSEEESTPQPPAPTEEEGMSFPRKAVLTVAILLAVVSLGYLLLPKRK